MGKKRSSRPVARKVRAVRALREARGDVAKLAVAYDWFRAEIANFAACGGDTKRAALLMENAWEAAEMVNEMNKEIADHGR